SSTQLGVFTQVSAGYVQTCGIKTDSTVACWGGVFWPQTPPAGAFTQVSAGGGHNCGVKTDETVACWGNNDYGEAAAPAGTFLQVSAGGLHTCGLTTRERRCAGATTPTVKPRRRQIRSLR